MVSNERFSVPLLAKLIPDGVRPGTILLVEFDPESQWFTVATTIIARWLQEGHYAGYVAFARPPEDIIRDLSALGVDVPAAVKSGRLLLGDWYSATLTGGRLDSAKPEASLFEPIPSGFRVRSLKVADLSVVWLKTAKEGPQPHDVDTTWPAGSLFVGESLSVLLRFNEEKAYMEYAETRVLPEDRRFGRIMLYGIVRGIHSEWLYKRMEAACDGVIDIRVIEQEGVAKDLLRVRSLRGQPRDATWHTIEIRGKGEAVLTN